LLSHLATAQFPCTSHLGVECTQPCVPHESHVCAAQPVVGSSFVTQTQVPWIWQAFLLLPQSRFVSGAVSTVKEQPMKFKSPTVAPATVTLRAHTQNRRIGPSQAN
jgi:hypothetical protein